MRRSVLVPFIVCELIAISSFHTLHADAAVSASSFTVDSPADLPDVRLDGLCLTSNGECTLRAALDEANNSPTPVAIRFAIPGLGLHTISPATVLPALTNPQAGITIDGFTQPGSRPNTDPQSDNALRTIEIAGGGPSGIDGIRITSSGNTIRGINIHGFRRSLWMQQPTSGNNSIVGNLVGLLPSGGFDPTNRLVPGSSCIVVQNGAHDNHIGTAGNANRNTISGCSHQGVAFYNGATTRNFVQNNIIGLDPTGTQRRQNQSHGVDINGFTSQTMVGGLAAGERNVISGNTQTGVEISHGTGTVDNAVVGNFIGTDTTGLVANLATRNNQHGVRLEGLPNCNNQPCALDEGNETITDNIIVNSAIAGVWIDKGVHDSVVARNWIGTMPNGIPAANAYALRIEAGSQRITVIYNIIANNQKGIQITPYGSMPTNTAASPTSAITVLMNVIDENGTNFPIDIAPFGVANDAYSGNASVNGDIRIPVLSAATSTSIAVSTCPGCLIELVTASGSSSYGGATATIGTAYADNTGHATIAFDQQSTPHIFSATATDSAGSTSEYARNLLIP